ncbi:MAG: hypothetical protein HKM06_08625 [Spirochaetales bacterium]|nr:hypothetical protein [Spirochaetales bacterium]
MKAISFGGNSGSPQTAAWHAWRQMGIGGSDSIILAADEGLVKAPAWVKTSKWLWEVKTGRRSGEIPANFAMKRGTESEGLAREMFIRKTGIFITPMFGENEKHPFIRSSFDGVDFCQEVIAEIKVPSLENHLIAKGGHVPEYYLVQMAHQAVTLWEHPDLFDGKQVNYVSLHPETNDLVIIDKVSSGGFEIPLISCLKPLAERIIGIESIFWNSVKSDTLPCGTEWVVAANEYLAAEKEMDVWKQKGDLAKSRLIELLGEKTREVGGGITMSRVAKAGSVDYKALIKAHLPDLPEEEIEKFRKSGSESFAIRKYDEIEA